MDELMYRDITEADIHGLLAVRVVMHENRLTREELTALGITDEQTAAAFPK